MHLRMFKKVLQIFIPLFFSLPLLLFKMEGIHIASLNINGLNVTDKQRSLIIFLQYNKIQILLIQEHNIRNKNVICQELHDLYYVNLNLAIAHKGGTAILIDKRLDFRIRNNEMSADSRIISMSIQLYEKPLYLVNIYAPSGSRNSDRENFFKENLTYYLRNNLDNSVIGGYFNCITSARDSISNSTHVCKILLDNFRKLNSKDVWFINTGILNILMSGKIMAHA